MYVRVTCRLGGYIACVNEKSIWLETVKTKGTGGWLRNERDA